jgi:hypothetical protein
VAPDVKGIEVGKQGESVGFAGMGPVALKVKWTTPSGSIIESALVLDKAYLPVLGDSSQNIISTGRLFALQGVQFIPNDVMALIIGDMHAKATLRNFSPFLEGMLFDAASGTELQSSLQSSSHMRGEPSRSDSYKVLHIRYAHAHADVVFRATGVRPDRQWRCHICHLFKAITPTARADTRKITGLGELLSMDAFGPFHVPAMATGWTHVLGCHDVGADIVDGIGTKEPTGKIAASYLNEVCEIYATVFKVRVKAVQFDNATIFVCAEVTAVLVKWNVTRHQTVEYMHWQLRIERDWRWMQHDAATMCAFAMRGKGYYIHACLHSLDLRSRLLPKIGQTKSAYELATGIVTDPTSFRIFGSNMYGTLLPEKRKQMGLDKADARAIQGVYVGNCREQPSWKLVTTGKIHTFGAGVIDEVSALAHAPKAGEADESYVALSGSQVRNGLDVFTYEGALVETLPMELGMPSTGARAPDVAVPALTLAQARPRRNGQLLATAAQSQVPFANNPPRLQAAVAASDLATPVAQVPARVQVIIPQEIWPRYKCAENDGKGWSAEIVSEKLGRVTVRFVKARTASGAEWSHHELRSEALIRLGSDGKPVADADDVATTLALRSHALAIGEFAVPAELALLAPFPAVTEEEITACSLEYACVDPVFHYDMMTLAHRAGNAPEMAKVMVMVKGIPTWWPLPKTWNQAKNMPNSERWKSAMQAFVDKTSGVDGFKPVPKATTKGKPKARLSWVFKYGEGPDGMPVEKARLVYNYASDNGEVFQELSYSNVTKPLHWKAFIHASLVDGATIYRRDVVNAHQSVRRGPDLEPCYTFGIPGISMLDESGCECDIMWFNYLNGMPPVGAAFSSDLAAHLSGFSMRPIVTDDYVYVRFDDLANVGTDYCKACGSCATPDASAQSAARC